MPKIDIFISVDSLNLSSKLLNYLTENSLVEDVFVLGRISTSINSDKFHHLPENLNINRSKDLLRIADNCKSDYALFVLAKSKIELHENALERLNSIAHSTGKSFIYCDYLEIKEENLLLTSGACGAIKEILVKNF